MNLREIKIKNYRSIDELSFKIEQIDSGYTYTLIGINESGKSSFLMAIDLMNKESISYPYDYFDENNVVSLTLKYSLTLEEHKKVLSYLKHHYHFDNSLLSKINIEEIQIDIDFEPETDPAQSISEKITFSESIFPDYTVVDEYPLKRDKSIEDQPILDLNIYFEDNLPDYFWQISHHVTFWKSTPEYLIIDEIDLIKFSSDPERTSIPLKNCFNLAGVNNISEEIEKLSSPVAIQNLEELLGDKITTHINKIWLEHPVKIKFKINNNKLTFLVEDKGVKFKNKTTSQRSDGFRQLISFLLTLSAESKSRELANTILLLDEPETHLHPTAQINLKDELIKLSKNDNNNIVFFATHSNYMIDKSCIERCYKVVKEKNNFIKFEQFHAGISSYSEVNYEVFDIPTNDFHNELYGYIEDTNKQKLYALPKVKNWFNDKKGSKEDVSLPTYIRHSIHHPENTRNPKFSEKELKESIEILKSLKIT